MDFTVSTTGLAKVKFPFCVSVYSGIGITSIYLWGAACLDPVCRSVVEAIQAHTDTQICDYTPGGEHSV